MTHPLISEIREALGGENPDIEGVWGALARLERELLPPMGRQFAAMCDFSHQSWEQIAATFADVDREFPDAALREYLQFRGDQRRLLRKADELIIGSPLDAPTYDAAIQVARELVEDGSNAEYTRGIAELIADLFPQSGPDMSSSKAKIALDLGIPPTAIT